jgi:SHS2 domain-containing protein
MTNEFDLRDHTADVAVEATGESLEGVFGAVADGLAAAMCDDVPEHGGERFSVTATADTLDGLLYDYLGELIYERDVRGVLPVDNETDVSERTDSNADLHLEATARGVGLAAVNAREIKAVTYSEMTVEERDREWDAYVVFDV